MSATISAPRKSGHQCNCGCSDCKGDCCELDCLVQPRFFCGQLLTDQDLNALLEWVKGKTALARYRHGWGAVCGLEVRCGAKAGEEAFVSVSPGYAVDCCGNDIVVCREDRIDLSKYCRPEEDPCGEWPPRPPQPPPPPDTMLNFGGWEIPQSQVQAVDLYVRYAEKQSDARTALARGGCSPAETCEYTRTQESYELHARRVEYCEHSAEQLALDWEEGYRTGLRELFAGLPSQYNSENWRATLDSLLHWLKTHPLRGFCFVREWLCQLQRSLQPVESRTFDRIIFWLVQDWRNNYFRCDCYGCGPDSGVPIARVWLWRQKGERGKQICKVVYVNSYPPFRRVLREECWPAQSGAVSLAPFIWQPVDYAFKELRNLGFDQITVKPFEFASLSDLKEQFANDLLYVQRTELRSTPRLTLHFYDDNCEQRRVVRVEIGPNPLVLLHQGPVPEKGVTEVEVTGGGELIQVAAAEVRPDDPSLDVRRVLGIGDASARRLAAQNITNLRDLADADAARVKEALSTIPINPPDEARVQAYIRDARELLDNLQKGT